MRKIALTTAAFALAACAGAKTKPTSNVDFGATAVTNCYNRARNVDTTLGANPEQKMALSLFMYVDKDGAVPAAFIHDAKSISSGVLQGCLLDSATGAKFDSQKTDWLRPEEISIQGAHAQIVPLTQQPPGELDEKLAQGTLTFAGWATPADKGFGYYYVHDFAKAAEQFKAALAANPNDAQALRGQALTLVATKGDLKQAQDLAQKATAAEPDSVAAQEALVRVCLAAKDDKCTLDAWEKAVSKSADPAQKQARSFTLAEIQDQVKEVADHFNAEEAKHGEEDRAKAAAAAQKANDPTGCGRFPEGNERTECFVKYCFEKGAQTYGSTDMKAAFGSEFTAGPWKTTQKGGKNIVSVQLKPKRGQKVDASWEVSVGDSVQMKPLDIHAAHIAERYSACKK